MTNVTLVTAALPKPRAPLFDPAERRKQPSEAPAEQQEAAAKAFRHR